MSDQIQKEYVFYRNRPEWEDLKPVRRDESKVPCLRTNYSEKFKDCYDYLGAILTTREISERALELTQTAINLNPGNHTVWKYRLEILKGLNRNLREELEFTQKIIFKYFKNYQVWHYRTIIVELLQDPSKELPLTARLLKYDARNYHVWQHRQWVLKTFNLFDGELDFVHKLLTNDARNNSVWSQRYFVIEKTTRFTEEVLKREIDYTLFHIKGMPENESAWNYLRGLVRNCKGKLSQNKCITQFCEELYNSGNRCSYLLAVLVEMCYEQVNEGRGDSVYTLERAKELCNGLKTEYDPIRRNYWEYMSDKIEKKAREGTEDEAASSMN